MPPSTRIGFLDLPREIRDQIMELVLHPGEVHIYANPGSFGESVYGDEDFDSSAELVDHGEQHRYGVQLLATCRQIYEEGHKLWYEKNIFYLSPCPFREMKRILSAYQEEHLSIIGRLVVRCRIDDVNEEEIRKLEESAAGRWRVLNVNRTGYGFTDYEDAVKESFERYLKKHLLSRFKTAVNKERLQKIKWLYRKVPNGHRMLIDNQPFHWPTEERVLFELRNPKLVVVLRLTRIDLEIGTTCTTELKENGISESMKDTRLELHTVRAEEFYL